MSISTPAEYNLIVHKEVRMFTKPTTQVVQWQDLKVKSEVDIVFGIAQQNGWKDCEIFGHGDMITQPLESMGWKLIPADLYEYSIPAEGAERVLQTINAGVRIKGVIIADDQQRKISPPAPTESEVSLPSVESVLSFLGKAFLVVGAIVISPLIFLGAVFSVFTFDPKLIILVDDGNGDTVWVSLLTWYE